MHNMKKSVFASIFFASSMGAHAVDLITTDDASLSIGGYVKAEALFDMPDSDKSNFQGNMRQSRINFTTTKVVDDQKVTGFIEGDFYGGDLPYDTYDWRARHAFINVGNLTMGKTWNGQFFAVAPFVSEQLDIWGPAFGTIVGGGGHLRPDLTVHYTLKGFRFTAQDPAYYDASLPDIVASYTNSVGSSLGYSVAITAREVENGSDSDIGAGISLAGRLSLGDGSLHASAYNGKGMGVYSGVCVGGAWGVESLDAGCDAKAGKLVSQTGYSVGFKYNFTEKFRGNTRYGEVIVDDFADTSVGILSANLIYQYLPGLDIGIEWRDRSRATAPWRSKGEQVELMAMYSF